MKNLLMNIKFKYFLIIISVLFFTFNCKKKDVWVWEIENEKFTQSQIEDAYEGYLFWWALQFNTTPEKLKEQIATIDTIEDPRQKELLTQLKKDVFLNGEEHSSPLAKKLLVVNIEAKKSNFLKREDIQKKLDFMNKFFIYNLYMMDQVKPNAIEISDTEALTKFEELRNSNPQYRSIPILKGQEMTKQQLFMQAIMTKQEKVINDIYEEYRIKNNPEFDMTKLIKKDTTTK